eukprot:Nk52_evm65s224 gene=Nk52_evmTU65s224
MQGKVQKRSSKRRLSSGSVDMDRGKGKQKRSPSSRNMEGKMDSSKELKFTADPRSNIPAVATNPPPEDPYHGGYYQSHESALAQAQSALSAEVYRTAKLQEELYAMSSSRLAFLGELNQMKETCGMLRTENEKKNVQMDKLAKVYTALDDKFHALQKKYDAMEKVMKGDEKWKEIDMIVEEKNTLKVSNDKLARLYSDLDEKYKLLTKEHGTLAKACSILDDRYESLKKKDSSMRLEEGTYAELKDKYERLEVEAKQLKSKNTRLAQEIDKLRRGNVEHGAANGGTDREQAERKKSLRTR